MRPIHAASVAGYRRAIRARGEPVIVRRITGTDAAATVSNANVHAIVMDYKPLSPVMNVTPEGAVTLGARTVIVLEHDLYEAGFNLPVTKNDKIVVRGEELNIKSVDPNTRNVAGAVEIVAEGV
jgi:hypothetical protein